MSCSPGARRNHDERQPARPRPARTSPTSGPCSPPPAPSSPPTRTPPTRPPEPGPARRARSWPRSSSGSRSSPSSPGSRMFVSERPAPPARRRDRRHPGRARRRVELAGPGGGRCAARTIGLMAFATVAAGRSSTSTLARQLGRLRADEAHTSASARLKGTCHDHASPARHRSAPLVRRVSRRLPGPGPDHDRGGRTVQPLDHPAADPADLGRVRGAGCQRPRVGR